MNRRHLVVGYNATASSAAAALWAADEAVRRRVPLHLVSCHPTRSGAEQVVFGPDIEALAEGGISGLEGIRSLVHARHPSLSLIVSEDPGSPRVALSSTEDDIELVVVGSSHREGAAGFWLGSTARWLAHHSDSPVVVVRRPATRAAGRIVVGTDGSRTSPAALDWAAAEAELLGAELAVVHAWSAPYSAVDPASAQAHAARRLDAARVLACAVEHLRRRANVVVTSHLVEDDPAVALLAVADPDDLVVVGAKGRSALATALFGSTVDALLDRSIAPVVVVRSGVNERR